MIEQTNFLNRLKWIVSALAIGGLLVLVLWVTGAFKAHNAESENEESSGQAIPENAHTLKVSTQAISNTLKWEGEVRSKLAVDINPKINARIVEIRVQPGDKLKKGAIIARLDDRELQASLNAALTAQNIAQAEAAKARADEERVIDAYHKQTASKESYDAALAQAQTAQALVQKAASDALQARSIQGENVLYAPFDGVVSQRLQNVGDLASPTQAIVTFHNPEQLRLEVAIADHCVALVSKGMQVPVRIESILQTLTGTVDEISTEVNPETHTQPIKISLPITSGLQQGQIGSLELSCQATQQALLIPISALLEFGQLQAVKIVDGDQTHIHHIRIGKRYGDQLEVLSGLHEGDEIMVDVVP
ncbi:efflux RND transporter periplasmic adaptor subunit [Methylomonas sp. AM2-LC]|uniref:efflux RND transporter periplasmic adaptor subunit n=1 Tax=Methylomonas sp. AM2-LC TaxID=3153301 RepID=UPI0032661BDC